MQDGIVAFWQHKDRPTHISFTPLSWLLGLDRAMMSGLMHCTMQDSVQVSHPDKDQCAGTEDTFILDILCILHVSANEGRVSGLYQDQF